MKTLATIALSFVVIISGLGFLLSSVCAASSGLNTIEFSGHQRFLFALCALLALGFLLGAIWLIGKLNRLR